MKTAVRHMLLGSCLLALGLPAHPICAHAQSVSQTMPMATPTNSVSLAGTTPGAPPKMMPPATNAVNQEIKIPDLPSPLSGEGKGMKNADSSNGGKIPDSVKDVIKRLNAKTDDVTLDDLNNAREAVAKLDALIDIEKRLVDLDKIRREREKGDRATLMAAALPASALTPPPAYLPPPMPVNTPPSRSSEPGPTPLAPPAAAVVDVLQIEGSNSHYVAFIKEGETTQQVRAGDHLSDGSTVLSVSKRGVELQRNNKDRLIEVKDVQSVFGNAP